MPPPGGFKLVGNYASRVKASKFHGGWLFVGTAVVSLTGLYITGLGNRERRGVKLERRERRAAMIPFLQAEEDVRYVRDHAEFVDVERRIMKDVPGWEAGKSVYLTRDWFPPTELKLGD